MSDANAFCGPPTGENAAQESAHKVERCPTCGSYNQAAPKSCEDPWHERLLWSTDWVFVRRVLERVTYKAGWRFGLSAGSGPKRMFVMAWSDEPDTNTGEVKEQVRWWPVDWPPQAQMTTETQVMAWLRHAIHEWEAHEVDEWLRLDGQRFHDPHACPQCLIGGCRA